MRKNILQLIYFSILVLTFCNTPIRGLAAPKYLFKKIIIWGHKLHSSNHSYIHYAFNKAFGYLGYDTYWIDEHENTNNFDFNNALFIIEGPSTENIPLRSDCRYILHNCDLSKFKQVWDNNQCIILQVYTHDCLNRPVIKVDDCIYYQPDTKTLYMPWATDLLPEEIDAVKDQVSTFTKDNVIYWVGSIWNGTQGNDEQLWQFTKACINNNISLLQVNKAEDWQHIALIQNSYMAPALQGKWQCDVGYIPCRIFKNISYGQMGITNSKTVYDLFKGKIVYNQDPYQLFFDAQERIKTMNIKELFELMDFVKEKHTYLKRIEHILNFLQKIRPLDT